MRNGDIILELGTLKCRESTVVLGIGIGKLKMPEKYYGSRDWNFTYNLPGSWDRNPRPDSLLIFIHLID